MNMILTLTMTESEEMNAQDYIVTGILFALIVGAFAFAFYKEK